MFLLRNASLRPCDDAGDSVSSRRGHDSGFSSAAATELGESTDPEALRALLAPHFERIHGIVEANGWTVEKCPIAGYVARQVEAALDAGEAVRVRVEMDDYPRNRAFVVLNGRIVRSVLFGETHKA